MAGMDEFPGNSQKAKDAAKKQAAPKSATEKPKVEKVVTSEVKVTKKGFGTKFKETFFGGEFRQARSYILTDVLLPALKNLVVDATSKGIERLIYGEAVRRRPQDGVGRPRVQYHSPSSRYSSPRSGPMMPDQPPMSRRGRDASDIILVSKEEAELVLERLNDILDTFEVVSIADLHELCGLPTTYVDNKWGWFNLSYADVKQVREGYLIDLPAAEPIGN